MKRKIKRKLFLMGMTLAAGMPGGAFAKESSKAEYQAYLRASHWHSLSAAEPLAGESAAADKPALAFSKLKAIVGRMNYAVEAPQAQYKPKGWRLEMLQSDIPADQADAPKAGGEKFLGLGLRMDF